MVFQNTSILPQSGRFFETLQQKKIFMPVQPEIPDNAGVAANKLSPCGKRTAVFNVCGKQILPVPRRNEVELGGTIKTPLWGAVFDGSPLPPFMRSVARQKQTRSDHRGTFPRRHKGTERQTKTIKKHPAVIDNGVHPV